MILTEDYTTWIIEKTEDSVTYENTDGKRWVVSGKCNQCGMCETYNDEPLNTPIDQINYRLNELGEKEEYTRTLIWRNYPGTPGAVEEVDYDKRLDIPMSLDATEKIEQCTLLSRWL